MDPKQFDQLLQSVQPPAPEQQPEEQPQGLDLNAIAQQLLGGEQQQPEGGMSLEQINEDRQSGILGSISSALEPPEVVSSALGGMAKSVFEMKDFVFGDTPDASRSLMRADIENKTKELGEESMLNGFAAGIGQFAGAMIGVGKLGEAAKLLPWVGKGVSAVASLPGGTAALEATKAAIAGAVAFDPQEGRLSNLVQDTPLANPVTRWLAADPDDGDAEGRLKSALESLGVDAILGSTLLAAGRVYKYLKAGDTEAAAKAVDDMQAEQRANVEKETAENGADQELTVYHGTPHEFDEFDLDKVGSGEGTQEEGFGVYVAEERKVATEYHRQLAARSNPEQDTVNEWIREAGGDRARASENVLKFGEETGQDLTELANKIRNPKGNVYEIGASVNKNAMVDLDKPYREQAPEVQHVLDEVLGPSEPERIFVGKDFPREVAQQLDERGVHGTAFLDSMSKFDAAQGVSEGGSRNYVVFNPKRLKIRKDTLSDARDPKPKPEAEIQPEITANPTSAAEDAGVNLRAQNPKPAVTLNDEDTVGLLEVLGKDLDAMETHGGWYQAVDAGHTFGKGEGIPYRKLNSDGEIDELRARLVDAAEEQLDKMKGGKVLSDVEVDKAVQRLVKVTGEDPAAVMGFIRQQGAGINKAVATMEVAYGLSNKMLQDAWTLAGKYRIGDYTELGSREATLQEIKKRLTLAADSYGRARAITAAGGRIVRRMRSEFALDPKMFDKIDGDQLVDILMATEANPRSLKYLAAPSIWQQIGDFALYLRVNSLVSGPKTQLINLMTTGYMVGVRPMERILGSSVQAAVGNRASQQIVKENIRQYVYMGTALHDGWSMALKAFLKNDSIISPHNSELYGKGLAVGSTPQALSRYKPWNSIPNIIYNALSVASVPVGLPTRLLGSTDELAKQVVYRSKVMARAHMEANLAIAGKNLPAAEAKKFVKEYIETKLSKSFDEQGRGIDPEALREAQIATFQQDLLQGTLGKNIQNLTNNWKPAKLVLPFVKTPTNVIRYGWKMTPVLNVAQKEYRDMLLGNMGREAQAQAVGQMTMGTLFMGAAAYMASNGMITGGGPKDPKLKQELMATGWKPYSVVSVNEDGSKTYTEYGRMDPVAIPFGIIADLQDAMTVIEQGEENEGIAEGIAALTVGLAKQFTNKSYLLGVNQMMEAMQDPERRGTAFFGNLGASFVPYSAATRQLNQDDYMREARTVADRVLQVVPGLSDSLPARYNWLGEPILNRQGLWTSDDGSLVDSEVQRLALEHGAALSRVSPSVNGVDLRDITMANGKNAYEEYQRLSGKPTNRAVPLRTIVARVIQSEAYKKAPDGDADVKGTKLWLLTGRVSKYRQAAMKVMKKDPKVREAFMTEDMKVRDHYKALRSEELPKPSDLGSVGAAFGVDTGN